MSSSTSSGKLGSTLGDEGCSLGELGCSLGEEGLTEGVDGSVGVVDSTFDGVAADASGTLWYIEDGVVQTNKYGLYTRGSHTYYFIGGSVMVCCR